MKKTSKNKRISYFILAAQAASNGGKRKGFTSFNKRFINAYKGGYKKKDSCILQAINGIINSNSDFRFFVKKTKDRNGKNSYLVYFNFKLDNERKQISFHCFNNELEKFVTRNSQIKTKWDKKDSQETADELCSYFEF